MLLSHHHRFVFIRPRKTASSSVEVGLARLLEPGDHATRLGTKKQAFGEIKPGVCVESIWFFPRSRFFCPIRLRNHSSLEQVYAVFGAKVADYRVVSMTRNPWDRAVSRFFYDMRRTDVREWDFAAQKAAFIRHTHWYGPRTWLDAVYRRKTERALDNCRLLYFVNGRCRADYVIRYECLEQDLAGLQGFLGLPAKPSIAGLHLKQGIRPSSSRRAWMDFYDTGTRELVAECCRWEIEQFGYDFEGRNEPCGPVFRPGNRPEHHTRPGIRKAG